MRTGRSLTVYLVYKDNFWKLTSSVKSDSRLYTRILNLHFYLIQGLIMDFDGSDYRMPPSLTTTTDHNFDADIDSDSDFELEISSNDGENIDDRYLASNCKIV